MKDRPPSIRKAAILIASLDQATAESLLAQMPREQAYALTSALETLGEIDPAEQEAVIDEFFRIGPMLPEDQPAGIDLHRPTIECREPATDDETPRASDVGRIRTPQQPFGFLARTNGSTLAARLRFEHPQTIAVVVSHLAPDCGAEVLASLQANLQAEVARRLVDLEETDPETIYEIERGLEVWLSEQDHSSRRRTAGMTALQNILAAADPLAHELLLANLARHDRPLANQLNPRRGRSYRFAELPELDDASLGRVLSHADQDVLALAMTGAGKALVARACRVLPVARAARLRRALERSAPVRVSEVEDAQQELADLAGTMLERDELNSSIGRKLSIAI